MKKDPKNEKIFQDIGKLMGRLVSVLIVLFDPSLVFIAGYLGDLYPYYKSYLLAEVNARCFLSMERGTKIIPRGSSSINIYTGISDVIYHHWLPLCTQE
jgi:predicted NBD/HSP70 family sugar kinase